MVCAGQILALLYQLRNLLVLFRQLLLDTPRGRGQRGLPGRVCGFPCEELELGLQGIYALHVPVDLLLVPQVDAFGLVLVLPLLLVVDVISGRVGLRLPFGAWGHYGWYALRLRCY
jgi:hypothetical protein